MSKRDIGQLFLTNFHQKNIFQLINSCDCRIPEEKLYICKILSLEKIYVFILSIIQFIWRDLTIVLEAVFEEIALQKYRRRCSEVFCKKDPLKN